MADRPEFIPPRVGDHVKIKTTGRVVEMRLYAGVPGAVVQLDPTVGGLAHDHPDGVPPARIWLPLDALAVIPSAPHHRPGVSSAPVSPNSFHPDDHDQP